uniref:Sulfatase N-terminal domain-containing protein n=1 Tax=Glossina austeni TaxID=7395 RepID=A0A1A9UM16_GLOAU
MSEIEEKRKTAPAKETENILPGAVQTPVVGHVPRSGGLWRDLTAYWILGLCNIYGYVVMLSAAHDVLDKFPHQIPSDKPHERDCHLVSTGAILLADVLPAMFVKMIMPFVPFRVHFLVAVAVISSAAGFLLVAMAYFEWMAILGVVITSASCGIGDSTFLGYSSKFNKNVVSTWSSGGGAAGVIASVSYATLTEFRLSPSETMLVMLIFPFIEAMSFWVLLRKPQRAVASAITGALIEEQKPLIGFAQKFAYARTLVKYMMPLALGLFELVLFKNIFLDKASQYRWLNVAYRIGEFVARSSVNLCQFPKIWLMVVFQFMNLAYFFTEVTFFYTPSIWITFTIIVWEGLLGGGGYVNTFYRMSHEIPPARLQFAMATVVQADAYGIALAGFLAIPVHNAICSLPTLQLAQSSDIAPPNIVIIMADDMGFDDVSFRGAKEFITPNIDALAYHGKILHRLYAPPMCTPSRSALLTGLYPFHTGTQHYILLNQEPWGPLTNFITMPEVFQAHGYSTNLIGKWHLGMGHKQFTPTYNGFDYHYGYWGAFIDYYDKTSKMETPGFSLGYDFRRNLDLECDKGNNTYVTDLFTAEAERIIMQNSGSKPLFLLVTHLAVHTANEEDPLQAPEEEIEKFSYIPDIRRRKYAGIQKNSPWEGGTRVSGAIWAPVLQNQGSIFQQPMHVADWFATLAAAANIPLNKSLTLDGINLWTELVTSKTDTPPYPKREIVHSLDTQAEMYSYSKGQYKYIKGTSLEGRYDYHFSQRPKQIIDPREKYYYENIRQSAAFQALQKYDKKPLTNSRMHNLRVKASVQCEAKSLKPDSNCKPLEEECLFNIWKDPCERRNLGCLHKYDNIMKSMREDLLKLKATAVPPLTGRGSPEYDPSRYDCTWTNYLDIFPKNCRILDKLAKILFEVFSNAGQEDFKYNQEETI